MKPPQELSKHLKHAKSDVDENALVKMRTLLGWMAKIISLVPKASRGIDVRRSLDGDVWTINDSLLMGNLTVNTSGVVKPGTVGGVMPKIGADRLDISPAPDLGLTGSGTEYVVVNIAGALVVTAGVLVESLTLAAGDVTLTVEATDPGPTGLVSDDGTFTVLLATFVDGVKTYQRTAGDWNLEVCDDDSGTATCELIITV